MSGKRSLSMVVLAGVIMLTLIATCGDKAGGIYGPGPQVETETYNYTLSGNTLVLEIPQEFTRRSYCIGNTPVVRFDTSRASTQEVPFELNGDILTIPGTRDTLETSGAVVELLMNLSRSGTGSGLQGTWSLNPYSYRIISGTPTAKETEQLNAATEEIGGLSSGQMTITASQITVTSITTSSFAEDFIDEWNRGKGMIPDSARYAITVTMISSASVELTGQNTSEKVTISEQGEGDITYSSSNAAHQTHIYYVNPDSCPNPQEPAWYQDFLDANLKLVLYSTQGLRKSAAPLSKPNAGIFKFLRW